MAQKRLPFKYEEDERQRGITSLGGLPLYLDLANATGLYESVRRHIQIREDSQGWRDSQVIMSLILLNLSGGDCVEDLEILEADEGFCRILRRVELSDLSRKERRKQERRWRKENRRFVPSPTAVFRYLEAFHDEGEEKKRRVGKAFIPAPNKHLRGFARVNTDLMTFARRQDEGKVATLDMDATLVETAKAEALYSYKGFKSYHPMNVWWAEQGVVLHTEFRDGNVPAGFEQRRVLEETLECLPDGVEKVRLRSDTAGYQHDLLRYCEMAENKRFGRIEFGVGCDVTDEFKKAVLEVKECEWHPIYKEVGGKKVKTAQEWAEVCFVPNAIGHSKKGPEYRYIAWREPLAQRPLPGMEQGILFPFPTLTMNDKSYKIFGLVTNMEMEGEGLIHWYWERCGKSEEVHGVMKNDLAGGKLPSGSFGENAAWWWCMILAFNLNALMKSVVLRGEWKKKRMKAIRYWIINIPARIIKHSRELIIQLRKGHPSFSLIRDARLRIMELGCMPAG
ncbi:MAG: IS1380 family transposase [Acidobacteriota bacterium]|nr:IS1380 family transposase [Acidobacteriota bacterium]